MKKQSGYTLIELLIVLIVTAAVVIGASLFAALLIVTGHFVAKFW
jgi:prepilin-type N-terminal cleavage/methylation domain-containing protein